MQFWHLFPFLGLAFASKIEIPQTAYSVLSEKNLSMLTELKTAYNLGEPTDPVVKLFFEALCYPTPGSSTHSLESITTHVCYFLDYLQYPEKSLNHLKSVGACGHFYYRPGRKYTTLIHDSLVLKNTALLEYTIEAFSLDVNSRDFTNLTPLGLACKHRYRESAKLLIEKFGANYLPDIDGSNSLLHLAFIDLETADPERDEFVFYLFNIGVDVNCRNEQGQTLAEYLYTSSIFMYCFYYPLLLKIGAKVLPAEVNDLAVRSIEVNINSPFQPIKKRKRTCERNE